jgi:hypothetical protein
MSARLILKQPTGWFAAGREFAQALTILSDGTFKLYAYLCLRADRYTGRIAIEPNELARSLHKDGEAIAQQLVELKDHGLCCIEVDGNLVATLEICDRFWPYQKQAISRPSNEQAEFVRRVRDLFLAPACVQATFTAADHKTAVDLYRRGIALEQVRRAILLGCARKYIAVINGQLRLPIASLQYFAAVIDEVLDPGIPESYWEPLRRKVVQMETDWSQLGSDTK